MSLTAQIDRPKLEKSLRKFSKQYGDSSAQAVVRWSIQTCREAAYETQPWGSKAVRKTQQTAIERDLGRVVSIVERIPKDPGSAYLTNPQDVIAWMDENRIRNHRTRKLTPDKKKRCSREVFKKTVREIMKNAGIAKGGFLGAGEDIARAQRGEGRITLGKNFLSYARKHTRFGDAKPPRSGWKPVSTLTNKARHTGSEYVLKKTALRKAVEWGLKKTVTWYRRTLAALDKKEKP